ncbi:MAG: conserved hypothetical rane protein [Symbiobacteriaceae bacterium]|jgi:uncharacterized membrane protein YraQ (UPF0718 family)|nr:conserved hypothetical rane protein [Symbiobacteriaceae bacterium]
MKFRLLALLLLAELVLAFVSPHVARSAAVNTGEFLWNILMILPMILILMGLFDAWVPRSTVERNVGPGSGIRGVVLSILLGTAAAGPLYAAFPLAKSMQAKGAGIANITIFLGTWASVKIPMVAMEAHFVGLDFALLRLGLTVPGVILIGFILERMHGLDEVADAEGRS